MEEVLCEIRDLLIDVRTYLEFMAEKNSDMAKVLSLIANKKASDDEKICPTYEEIMEKLNL